MLKKGVTLRGIEVFETLARTGSVAQTAEITGMSQPAVSQQLRNLEGALDTALIDHSKRPMRLTPAGVSFLNRAETALAELRLAQNELAVMDLAHLSSLSIGIIDDFDDNLNPRLATILADSLTHCRFRMITASSNELARAMTDKQLHLAISASTGQPQDGIREYPLARDPFILVAPHGVEVTREMMDDPAALPFLRYDKSQLISRQIETYMQEHGVHCPEKFEIGSHLALMAMVARGIGWAVTTPLGYMRAARFHDQIDAFALPFPPVARQISLFAGADWVDTVPQDVARIMRGLIQSHMIDPALFRLPWLTGQLRTLDDEGEGGAVA